MPHYVDGLVVPVPEENLDSYLEMSREAGKIWREHGALEFRECVADDVPMGESRSSHAASSSSKGKIVVFSWIVFESREHRDRVNAEVMKDPRLEDMMKPEALPFDGKRMIYGGFRVAVDV